MIRQARRDDLSRIMEIVSSTVGIMNEEGNTQWDECYPSLADFLGDLDTGTLYVLEQETGLSLPPVKGFLCLDRREPEEYSDLSWEAPAGSALVLHRMAISPDSRRQGLGKRLLSFAKEKAKETGCRFVKTDTYSLNRGMNTLFLQDGYQKRGEMAYKGKPLPFFCYEKCLSSLAE